MIIYKTTNLINGKIYIGKDTKNNPTYLGSGKILCQSIKKYGVDNFRKDVIEECTTKEMLDEREKYWIGLYNSTERSIGYNIALGGEGGDTISNHPDKDRISKKHSEWMKENNPFRGKTHTDEVKQRISEANKKPKSEETKRKLSEANKGKKPGNMVKIEIDGIVYESLTDASIKNGINISTLRNRIKSKNPKYVNYKRYE